MNRSLEQALFSLLPAHNSDLPQPLLELAGSLLAQSRQKASTLKTDEEIALPYACAHLACDRLKISLNLPPIDPRPPVPPRIYKRLYTHLDKILPNSSFGSSLSSGRVRTQSSKLRELNGSARATPSKEQSLSSFRSPSASKPGTPSKLGRPTRSSTKTVPPPGLPPWIRPTLRHLCKQLDNARIGPIVMAGIESIVTPQSRRTDDEWVTGHLTPLLGSLYLYVWGSVNMPDGLDEARYVRARRDVVEALTQARETIRIKDFEEDEAWEGWGDISAADIDTAALRINRHGWLESDWAKSIEDLVQRDATEATGNAAGDQSGHTPSSPVKRADTMMQDRYDYLSERKRKEYAAWKAKQLRRIKDLAAKDDMELD